jgi:hypothetical protein
MTGPRSGGPPAEGPRLEYYGTPVRLAVLVLRWFLDGTRLGQLAKDNAIGRSTAYRQGSCKVVRQAVDLLGCRIRCHRLRCLASRLLPFKVARIRCR